MKRDASDAPETASAPSPEYLEQERIAATYEALPDEMQDLTDAVFDAAREVMRERFRTFGDNDEDRDLWNSVVRSVAEANRCVAAAPAGVA